MGSLVFFNAPALVQGITCGNRVDSAAMERSAKQERRKHPRVELPLEVDLRHPFIGTKTVVARDMNDEGVYAWYPEPPFKVGSSIDVTMRCRAMIESRPTPTVKMKVSRVDATGMVLNFSNKSGAHLWRTADSTQRELAIGEDLFRVFQAAVIRDPAGRILTVQQNGRWLYPGTYLQTGKCWRDELQNFLSNTLNLTETRFERTVLTHCDTEIVALESSIMSVFHLFSLDTADKSADRIKVAPSKDALYTKTRWIDGQRQLDELSFSAEPLRELARDLLRADQGPKVAQAATQRRPLANDSMDAHHQHG